MSLRRRHYEVLCSAAVLLVACALSLPAQAQSRGEGGSDRPGRSDDGGSGLSIGVSIGGISAGVGTNLGGSGEGLGLGGGASVGGSDGVNAGVDANVGGSSGVNAGVGASVGGSNGVNAGVGANVRGSNDVSTAVGASVGGARDVDAGVTASIGGSSGVIGGAAAGNNQTGTSNTGRPGTVSPLPGVRSGTQNPGVAPVPSASTVAAWRSMSSDEQQRVRRSCAGVLASPSNYEADLTTLCQFVSRVSAR
jgi:hypothetical protein